MDAQEVENPVDGQVDRAVVMLSMLADPTRLRIMWTLLHGEHSVNELADHLGARPAAVSQHLAKLRLSRLVSTRRQGTRIFYLADNHHVRRLVEQALFHADHVVQSLPAHHERPATRRRATKRGRSA